MYSIYDCERELATIKKNNTCSSARRHRDENYRRRILRKSVSFRLVNARNGT